MKDKSIVKLIYNKGKKAGERAEKLRTQQFLSKDLVDELLKLEQDIWTKAQSKSDELTIERISQIKTKLFRYLQKSGKSEIREEDEVSENRLVNQEIRIEEEGSSSNVSSEAIGQIMELKKLLSQESFSSGDNLLLIRYDVSTTHVVFKLVFHDLLEVEDFKAKVLLNFKGLDLVNENYYEQENMCYWHLIISTSK